MVHTISTFCYIGEHRLDTKSRLRLPQEVLDAFKSSNEHNLSQGSFQIRPHGPSLDVIYEGDSVHELVIFDGSVRPKPLSIDDLIFLSIGTLEGQTPVFNTDNPDLVFLYPATDGIRVMYHPPPDMQTVRLPVFRIGHIKTQDRIQLKPFEAVIAEGPEKYTRIEGYSQLSCFTLRVSDYRGRRTSQPTL
jgi:hypothetical protein